MSAQNLGVFRIVDNLDVVTHVPPAALWLLNYQHPNCELLWIDPNHQAVTNPPNPPPDFTDIEDLVRDFLNGKIVDPIPGPLADHSPVRYCAWIA